MLSLLLNWSKNNHKRLCYQREAAIFGWLVCKYQTEQVPIFANICSRPNWTISKGKQKKNESVTRHDWFSKLHRQNGLKTNWSGFEQKLSSCTSKQSGFEIIWSQNRKTKDVQCSRCARQGCPLWPVLLPSSNIRQCPPTESAIPPVPPECQYN